MLELRERNGEKHVVSDNILKAFAWGAYYANYSNVIINGEKYKVIHVQDCYITFNDGTFLPFGSYVIFEKEGKRIFYNYYKLRNIRNDNPLESHIYCFNDDTFLKIIL